MSDDLHRLVYLSTASRPMTAGELEDLLHGSRARNREHGITGILVYDAGRFVQVLEGPRAALEELYESIRDDPRHQEVRELASGPIERRDFEGWAMGFYNLEQSSDLDVAAFHRFVEARDPTARSSGYRVLLRFRQALERREREG